jgi:acetolactate synthase-1/2/3 large subunit
VSKEALAKKAHAKEVLTKEALARAVELITASERPYIYCGGGVLSAAAGLEVAQFAEHIDAVIGCSIMGLTAIPASHPRNLGMTGMHGREASIRAQDSADLIIAIGARFSDRATGNKAHYIADKKFLHLDIDAAEIDKNVSTSASLIGDIAPLLQALTAKLQPTKRVAWQEEIAAIVLEANAEEAPDDALSASDGLSTADTFDAPLDTPLDAKSIIRAVRKRSADDTIIVTDVGQHQMWVAQNYSFENPRTFLTSGGLGTMGFGMGAAIGACLGSSLANNTAPRKTVLFTGDGSFGMNLNEMATAVSQSLPLVIIIMNNGVLGMVRQWQALFYDERYSSTTLDRTTDFVALARAFGAEGCRVESRAELDTALDTAFAASGPFVVDCAIEKDEQVFPMIPPGGTIDNMLLG